MNYFNYQPQVPMGRIWNLFSSLATLSEEEALGKGASNCQYAHTLEIIHAAMGKSRVLDEDFDLRLYEFQCNKNDKLNKIANVEKELFIVDSTGNEKEDRVGFGDISERKLKSLDDIFSKSDSSIAFEENLAKLLNIRNKYIVTKGYDLVNILVNALRGVPDAVSSLKEVFKVDNNIKDLIVSLVEDDADEVLLSRLVVAM